MRNQLRVLRTALSWTQQDLADRANVSRQTIHAIEAGKYDPSLPLAFTLARLFERRIEDLFDPDATEAAT